MRLFFIKAKWNCVKDRDNDDCPSSIRESTAAAFPNPNPNYEV